MVLLFEVSGPFRWQPKVERVGALTRIIWGCFSVARIAAGFNDIARTFRQDERELCWRAINAAIKPGDLPGDGTDKTAERNGLVLASNILMDRMRYNIESNRLADNEPNEGNKNG